MSMKDTPYGPVLDTPGFMLSVWVGSIVYRIELRPVSIEDALADRDVLFSASEKVMYVDPSMSARNILKNLAKGLAAAKAKEDARGA